MADFVPSVFRDLGKNVNDIFTKKFKTVNANVLKIKTKTADGLAVTGEHKQDSKNVTSLSAKYSDKWGSAEGSINTEVNYDGSIKLTKLAEGVTVKAAASYQPQGNVEIDYKQANVAVTVVGGHKKPAGNYVGGALVVGFDGVSLGGETVYNVTSGEVVDYNAAFQFITASKDYELTVKSAKKFEQFTLFGLHKYNPSTKVVTQVDVSLAGETKVGASIGFTQNYDNSTVIQAKLAAGANTGVVSGAWEKILNPTTKLTLLTEFDAVNNNNAKKFGVGLTLGDLSDD